MWNFILVRDKFAAYSEENPGQADLILSAKSPIQLIAAVAEISGLGFEESRDLVEFGGLISNTSQDDFDELINWKSEQIRRK